jgi:hypothetical protein
MRAFTSVGIDYTHAALKRKRMKYPAKSEFRTFRISPQAHEWLKKRAATNRRSSTAEAYMIFEVLSKLCPSHTKSLVMQINKKGDDSSQEQYERV